MLFNEPLLFMLYRGNIYKKLKIIDKTARVIVRNCKTGYLYSITFHLFANLHWFFIEEDAKEFGKIYDNYFNVTNLRVNCGSEDAHTYNFGEYERLININKSNISLYKQHSPYLIL